MKDETNETKETELSPRMNNAISWMSGLVTVCSIAAVIFYIADSNMNTPVSGRFVAKGGDHFVIDKAGKEFKLTEDPEFTSVIGKLDKIEGVCVKVNLNGLNQRLQSIEGIDCE